MIRDVITIVVIIMAGIVTASSLSMLFSAIAKDFGHDLYRVVKVRRHRWLEHYVLRREARALRRIHLTSEDFEDWTEEFQDGSEG